MLHKYLEKFENILDVNHCNKVKQAYKRIFQFEAVNELPYLPCVHKSQDKIMDAISVCL
jgi:hypothetical protein